MFIFSLIILFLFLLLGTEFKSSCCPVTGVMTALEIQRGRHGMPLLEHWQELGATAACTLRLGLMHLKTHQDRAGIKGDAWFGSVKACLALYARGIESVFQVKTNHKLFPKQFIDDALQGMPGGVHIVLEGLNAYTEEKLYAVGYRYSKKTTLFFVMSPGAGSTRLGKPYEMKYPTEQGNLGMRFADRPDVVSRYFGILIALIDTTKCGSLSYILKSAG